MEVIVHESTKQQESFKQYEKSVRQQIFDHCLKDELIEQIYPHLRGEPGHNYGFRNPGEVNLMQMDLWLRLQKTIRRLGEDVRTKTPVERDAILYIAYREFESRCQLYRQFAKTHNIPFV